jgi:AcrR family transcriptional regulator
MGKVETNKANKRSSLLEHAYDLFINKGFNDTTISDIVKKSNVAKGTFYLYFKDKYDLRDQLVARESAKVLIAAQDEIDRLPEEKKPREFEGYVHLLIEYVLNHFVQNKMQLRFISKNLSWGVFQHVMTENAPTIRHSDEAVTDPNQFYRRYLEALSLGNYKCDRPDLLLFTIIELVGSTAYSAIINEAPCTIEEYKPYLFRSIHQIFEGYKVDAAQ